MIIDVKSVSVMFHGRKVGLLSMGDKSCCMFEYDKDWIKNGFSISPLHLPLKTGLFRAGYMPFNGNFGIFEDSVPGGYGEFMLQKVLAVHGVDYKSLTPVQRLSIVGCSGMGALCYVPETKINEETQQESLDDMQQMALQVLAEKTDEHAGLLYRSSGNSGGARPKCLYSDGDGHWLVKFRHTYDPVNIGRIEYMYNAAARNCGIDVPEFKMLEDKYFAVRRFDLDGDERLHVATASALLNEPISPPKMDYHSLLQLTGYLTQSPKAVEQQFRRMVFNVCARNYDDHARNFSFIWRDGRWRLAPAYDLTNDNTLGQHATTVNYNGLPDDGDLMTVGTNIRMTGKRCQEIIDEIRPVAMSLLEEIRHLRQEPARNLKKY